MVRVCIAANPLDIGCFPAMLCKALFIHGWIVFPLFLRPMSARQVLSTPHRLRIHSSASDRGGAPKCVPCILACYVKLYTALDAT